LGSSDTEKKCTVQFLYARDAKYWMSGYLNSKTVPVSENKCAGKANSVTEQGEDSIDVENHTRS
jgi:hypothetical protein